MVQGTFCMGNNSEPYRIIIPSVNGKSSSIFLSLSTFAGCWCFAISVSHQFLISGYFFPYVNDIVDSKGGMKNLCRVIQDPTPEGLFHFPRISLIFTIQELTDVKTLLITVVYWLCGNFSLFHVSHFQIISRSCIYIQFSRIRSITSKIGLKLH